MRVSIPDGTPHTGIVIGVLVVILIAAPLAELWVILQVAQGIGVPETIGLLVLISVAGAWLLKQQGMATWRRLNYALNRGRVPGKEVTDGALILLGGALLLTPGFITDAVGLVLLLPPTRAAVKGAARTVMARWARRRAYRGGVYWTEATRVERHEPVRTPATPPSELRSGEDGSRGTR
jgi:UPF0716 protein FxsA